MGRSAPRRGKGKAKVWDQECAQQFEVKQGGLCGQSRASEEEKGDKIRKVASKGPIMETSVSILTLILSKIRNVGWF